MTTPILHTLAPWWASDNGATRVHLYQTHVLDALRALPARSVHAVITSPPYFRQRNYRLPPQIWGGDSACPHAWDPRTHVCDLCGAWHGSLGLEACPEDFLSHLLLVFLELRRVLHPTGTLWINLADTYEDKCLLNLPGRFLECMRQHGFVYRAEIVWAKALSLCPTYSGSALAWDFPDRPTPSHEPVFLFSLRPKYFFDRDSVREPHYDAHANGFHGRAGLSRPDYDDRKWTERSDGLARPPITMRTREYHPLGRPLRSVWTVNPQPFRDGSHLATFPEDLVQPMILAGTSARGCCRTCGAPWVRDTATSYVPSPRHGADSVVGRHVASGDNRFDGTGLPRLSKIVATTGWHASCSCSSQEPVPCTVLDPFCGSGTTLLVAQRLGRHAMGIELSAPYCEMAKRRIAPEHAQAPLLHVPGGLQGLGVRQDRAAERAQDAMPSLMGTLGLLTEGDRTGE